MDAVLQVYMEETEELMQKAEDCIIRLETEYSSVDINELFRIAHTIKGSSHMVGYEDIGNLMHKVEDMLDYARNGYILFDQSIVSMCFEGLDTVKKMLDNKNRTCSLEIKENLDSAASRISEMIEAFIRVNRKQKEKVAVKQTETGIVSSLLNQRTKGKNKYYISIFIEEDAPMVSPVFMMIIKNVDEIGSLIYSSVSDHYFTECSVDNEIKTLDIIISTDMEEAELYTSFALIYIERINVVDLSRNKLQQRDVYLNDGGVDKISCSSFRQDLFEVYNKYLLRTFKPEKDGFVNQMKTFVDSIKKVSTVMVLVDTSQLTIIHESEIKELIEIQRQLNIDNIEMAIVVGGPYVRRIMNIFDSIRLIEEFKIYRNEMEAIQIVLQSDRCFQKLSKVVKDVLSNEE
ncbi:Hpt domain-containing protein [Petroclostridium sp. X23]|uniref:Hpt domain-containing protein n=1 Tax=Petroclostridium sp. X23 TaxID=3045146 RepID=UPI0024AD5C1E|nr:Hpt domain-containing protein [Petroclostridium sp. X23]WHH61364.1 Hpt domain-containing protein [Petroclostridium sp. X23]